MSSVLRILRTIFYKLGFAALTFVNTYLVTRYLTVSDKGIYSTITTTLLLGSTYMAGYSAFFNYGLNRLKFERPRVIGSLARFFLQATAGITALFLLSLALAAAWPNPLFVYGAFVLATMPFVILFGYCSRFLQALNEIDWLNRLNMLQGTVFFVLATTILLVDHFHPSIVRPHLLVITLAGWFGSNILAAAVIVLIVRRLAGVPLRPARNDLVAQEMFRYGRNISVQNVLTQFNLRGDFYSVMLLQGAHATGLYSIAVTASEVLWQVSSSVALIVYTRVAHRAREDSTSLTERTFRFTFWLMIVGAVVLFAVFSPFIHIIFTDRYAASVRPFQILLAGTTAYGTVGVLTQFFTDQLGKVRYPMYMQGASFATNVLLCVILIPHMGISGAALASSIAYGLSLVLSLFYFRRHTGRPLRSLFFFSADDVALLRSLRPRRRAHEGGK